MLLSERPHKRKVFLEGKITTRISLRVYPGSSSKETGYGVPLLNPERAVKWWSNKEPRPQCSVASLLQPTQNPKWGDGFPILDARNARFEFQKIVTLGVQIGVLKCVPSMVCMECTFFIFADFRHRG
jgi:hypothetical protein